MNEKTEKTGSLSCDEITKEAEQLDAALQDMQITVLSKIGTIIRPLIKLMQPGALQILELKNFKQYHEQRLKNIQVSKSAFYRYKDSAKFCYENGIDYTDDLAAPIMAIVKAKKGDRTRIWNCQLKHGEGISAEKIAEAIESERMCKPKNSKPAPEKATGSSQTIFQKLVDDKLTDFLEISDRIAQRLAALTDDKYGIQGLGIDELNELLGRVKNHRINNQNITKH